MKNQNLPSMNKLTKILLLGILIVCVLILYIFHNNIANYIALNTKSPKDYFSYIAKKNMKHSIEQLFEVSDKIEQTKTDNKNSNNDNTLALDVNFNDLFQSENPSSIFHNTEALSLNFSKLIDKNYLNYVVRLKKNNATFLTFSLLSDQKEGQFYIQIPELSNGTFSLFSPQSESISAESSSMSEKKKTTSSIHITDAQAEKLIKKYAYFFIDQIQKVQLDKEARISIHKSSQKVTELTFSLSFKDLIHIFNSFLDEASYDSDIEKILVSSGICNSTNYRSTLSLVMIGVNMYLHDKELDGNVIFHLWVNHKGNITGQNISYCYGPTNVTLDYKMIQDGMRASFISSLQYKNNASSSFDISAEGDGNLDGMKFDGDLITNIIYKNYVDSKKNRNYGGSLHFSLSDLFKKGHLKLTSNGTLTDIDNQKKYNINLNFNKKENTGKLFITRDQLDYITVTMIQKKESLDSLMIPSTDANFYYGFKEFITYIQSLNFHSIKRFFP